MPTKEQIDDALASAKPDPTRDWRHRAGLEAHIDLEGRQIQARFDSAYSGLGQRAPQRVWGESTREYELRLLKPLQVHSSRFSKANLSMIGDAAVLRMTGEEICADTNRAARANVGELRSVVETDSTGRKITRWFGRPGAAWDRFKLPHRFVKAFNGQPVF